VSEPLIATLLPRQSGGKHYYTYSVEFAGELIVEGSNNPEHDACRALLANGITGPLLLLDCATGKERSRIDIERGALWLVSEEQRGFRVRRWAPTDAEDSPRTGESLEGNAAAPEAA
jgi:hypothetical protein